MHIEQPAGLKKYRLITDFREIHSVERRYFKATITDAEVDLIRQEHPDAFSLYFAEIKALKGSEEAPK